ncbi:hypothetical protein [Xanthomonas sp. MUS 060]|uniref:hypothetical protein n=1 Tax=Xanthomonas sp. MUS 060 TaxID=1588031 RepID=UPI0009E51157|nr:hypothetical protein [Xanthomonas sp. MUS 060]
MINKSSIFCCCGYVWLCLVMSGCAGFVPFQPNPPEDEEWSKPGASQLDIDKAMLECGYPTPFGVRDRILDIFPSSNEIALMDRCMRNSGFSYSDNFNYCKGKGFRELPACQPDAIIPRRELSKRINSQYCKKYTKADACTP